MLPLPIRVLLVEDSPVALTILKRMLASSPDVDVVGTACNGVEAMELIPARQPQVICTDLHMPKMDGLELTRRVMAQYPRPILVVSASVHAENDAQTVFQLLQAGALDVFPKPEIGLPSEYEQVKRELIGRIKVLAGVKVFTRHSIIRSLNESSDLSSGEAIIRSPSIKHPVSNYSGSKSLSNSITQNIYSPRVVAIGASTGGPQALHMILKQIPVHFPIPILCVQHISEGFLQGLVSWLATECSLRMVVAQPGDIPKPGVVYFAPEQHHLQLDSQGRLLMSNTPPVSGHRPSVTVLFQSVAAYYRRSAVGILLTGMGRDGAEGLQAIAHMGGLTIAQDEQTCVVFGMPKEAIVLGAAQLVLPISEIAPALVSQIMG